MSLNDGMMSSIKQDYETPLELFYNLDDIFDFDCDLFASDENALSKKYFTAENSAFDDEADWGKINFANPPYATKIQNKAFAYAYGKSILGKTTVMLVPARTDTKRFHDYVFNKHNVEIKFLKGRIRFGVKATLDLLELENKSVTDKKRSKPRFTLKDIGSTVYLDPAPFPSCIIVWRALKYENGVSKIIHRYPDDDIAKQTIDSYL